MGHVWLFPLRVGFRYAGSSHRGALVAFRDGVRNNSEQMSVIATKMSDKEMKAVSDYIAGLR